ncbi:MAG: hypothetical protein ACKVRN_11315 [Pyrinomonadaceae bacterium]
MNTSANNLLIVTPYTKRLGMAVFQDGELIYFGVKTFKRPRTAESISDETANKLGELLDQFNPALVIVKSLTTHQTGSVKHRGIARTIKRTLNTVGISIVESSFEEARRNLVAEDNPPKKSAFAILRKLYPELARFVYFQNRHQSEYYTPMLAAITIGLAYRQEKPQNCAKGG